MTPSGPGHPISLRSALDRGDRCLARTRRRSARRSCRTSSGGRLPRGDLPGQSEGGEILRRPVATSLEEIPGELDVVSPACRDPWCASRSRPPPARGSSSTWFISSGFSDVGNVEEEKRITRSPARAGMRIWGPTSSHVLGRRLTRHDLRPGWDLPVTWRSSPERRAGAGDDRKTRSRESVSGDDLGRQQGGPGRRRNLLAYLLADELTHQHPDLHRGREARSADPGAEEATRQKPVVVIKSGRSEARRHRRRLAHRIGLAGSDAIFDCHDAPMRRAAGGEVKEAFDLCKFLSDTPLPARDNAVIITNGGHRGAGDRRLREVRRLALRRRGESQGDLRAVTPTSARPRTRSI